MIAERINQCVSQTETTMGDICVCSRIHIDRLYAILHGDTPTDDEHQRLEEVLESFEPMDSVAYNDMSRGNYYA